MWITSEDGKFDEPVGDLVRARCVRIADGAEGNARHRLQIGENWDDPLFDLEIDYFAPRLWARDDGVNLVFERQAHAFVVAFDRVGEAFRTAGAAPCPVAGIQPAIQQLLTLFRERARWESPDGTLVVDYEQSEFLGKTVIAPKLSDAATGRVWLDLTGMMWHGPARSNPDGTVDFRIGTVMDDKATIVLVRPARGDFLIRGEEADYRPLAELEEAFYRAAEIPERSDKAVAPTPQLTSRKPMARWLRVTSWVIAAPVIAFALLLIGAFLYGLVGAIGS